MRRLFTYVLLPSLLAFTALSSFAYQYGPVKPGETLWSIAKKVRPNATVPVAQMMQIIQDNNPHAFKNKNANSLLKNAILIIPDPSMTAAKTKTPQKKQTAQQKRQQLLQQLAASKRTHSAESISKLKEELKLSQIRFKKIEDRNQQLLKKMKDLHTQLRDLQVKMLEDGEHTLNTHTAKNDSKS